MSDPQATEVANESLPEGLFTLNRPLRAKRRLILFALGPASYVIFLVLSLFPTAAEYLYGRSLGPILARILSLVTGLVPLQLGEPLTVGLCFYLLAGGLIALRDVARKKRQLGNALTAGALRLAQYAGLIIGFAYLAWGFNYARPTLPALLGWPAVNEVAIEELATLAAATVEATNQSYYDLHGVSDVGESTLLPDDLSSLEDGLRDGWRAASLELGIPNSARKYGRAKTPIITVLYEWLGIAGYYFPFTGEANVRAGVPALDFPKMLAHEKAHQRGIARESEANFWGYLSAARSPDALTRYSAFRFASGQMLAALAQVDRDSATAIARLRLPGVRRDIQHSNRYWEQFRGRGTAIGSAVNNAFLRSNRVEGGVRSYSMSAQLIIAHARANGGVIVPNRSDR